MANEEQLAILRQGVEVWNKWQEKNLNVEIAGSDLRRADLRRVDLAGVGLCAANLQGTRLRGADLTRADLRKANLSRADLSEADLSRADLRQANLGEAILSRSTLRQTNLRGAHLSGADLREAVLTEAELKEAVLTEADLHEAALTRANLSQASLGGTKLTDLDLSQIIGLERVKHGLPSTIGTNTLQRSQGKIPDVFLRGCGLSDWEIEAANLYNPDLSNEEINNIQYRLYDLRAAQALQISPLFVSYSHADSRFVDKLGYYLQTKGIRYWRDIHDLKAGRIETQIDRAMRLNPTVLLVLSERSLSSDWVEHEVRKARELEKEIKRDVLCPVALDDSWKSSPWPERIMEQIMEYNILDFSAWRDGSNFDSMFRKLIDGLGLFYKGEWHGK